MSKTLVGELLKKLDREMMAKKILSELTNCVNLKDSIEAVMKHVMMVTDCEAIGIRLCDGNDTLFYAHHGFSHSHLCKGPFFCSKDSEVKRLKIPDNGVWTTKGLCWDVFNGNVDKDLPFFTSQGSFWTNDLQNIMEKQAHNCLCCRFKSLAMIRISCRNDCVGLIQLCSNYTPLTLDMIFYLEMIGKDIGTVFHNNMIYSRLKETYETLNNKLTPICASCKKINSEGEEWQNIEDYLYKHIGAEFTHDICPDCMEKLYPSIFVKIKERYGSV